jgi:hypothetical protein
MAIPCSWDVTCEACPDFQAWDQPTRDNALWLASTYLWAATGRRFGTCPVTVHPQQDRKGAPIAYQDFAVMPGAQGLGVPGGPYLFGGRWFNSGCATACCGANACAVVLRGPVAEVTEVVVGDEVISPEAYRVDITGGVYLLVRTDGSCWPVCNSGAPGEFEVTYQVGTPIPEALAVATAILACEYGQFLAGGACRLPASMTRLSRQGVEVEIDSGQSRDRLGNAGAALLTGIREVDTVVLALNPTGRQGAGVVMSPDMPGNCDRVVLG